MLFVYAPVIDSFRPLTAVVGLVGEGRACRCSLVPSSEDEPPLPYAVGGSLNAESTCKLEALSLPTISVEGAGVGGKPGRGIVMEAREN